MPRLSAHETIGGLWLVFPEIGRIAERTKEYSEQKTTVAAANSAGGKASRQGELTRARSGLIGCMHECLEIYQLFAISPLRGQRRKQAVLARSHVRYWPLADMRLCTAYVRF